MKSFTRWRILALLMMFPWALCAQTTQTVPSATCTNGIDVTGAATLGVQVTGTWSGTIQPEASISGQATVNIQVTPSTSSTAQSTITANGVYLAAVAGYGYVYLCGNTISSGTAVAYFKVSSTASSRGGGGGGSGTVTSVGFTGGLISVATPTTTPAFTVAGTSGGVPYFNAATTWASSGALTLNVLMKGGGAGGAPTNSSVTDNGTNVSTAEAFLLGNGTTTLPSYSFTAASGVGMAYNTTIGAPMIVGGNGSTIIAGFAPTTGPCCDAEIIDYGLKMYTDTGLTRCAAGVSCAGNGSGANTTGKFEAAGFMSLGTKFTTNNGCTDQATVGGATAGTFKVGAAVTSCTEIVTMGDTATAPNGWSCTAIDLTTIGDVTNPHQTASSTTTATFVSGTVVAGDVLQFSCVGY